MGNISGGNNINSNNSGGKYLPQTGSESTWFASMIGAALVAIGSLGFFKSRKKKSVTAETVPKQIIADL